MRLKQATKPYFDHPEQDDLWPVRWISPEQNVDGSFVIAYRNPFHLDEDRKIRIHVSADQRYRLFVDGILEGEGPSRGDEHAWYYESYDLSLDSGSHCIVAQVWSLDPVDGIMPAAQITIRHGFLLAADAPFTSMLSTGNANWECKVLQGINFVENGMEGAGSLSGSVVHIDGNQYPWHVETGSGEGWECCRNGAFGRTHLSNYNWGCVDDHILTPTPLEPPFLRRHRFTNLRMAAAYPANSMDAVFKVEPACKLPEFETLKNALSRGLSITIAANQQQWLLFDLEDYYCGYPEILVEHGSGATVRVLWAESLFEDNPGSSSEKRFNKGNRNDINGKFFFGKGDTFLIGSTSHHQAFTSFWWNSGRYVALQIQTGDQDLLIHRAGFRETRYPQELSARIDLSNTAFMKSKGMMWRTLQMCAHETYMDCPYYEQINYAGDTRIQALASYVASGEYNLSRKCIQHFSNSLLPTGLTQSRTPCTYRQVIPQFSLYWICMVHDYAMWRGEPEFVLQQLPAIRHVLETFLQNITDDGLLRCPDGWDWVDWVAEWETPTGNVNPRGSDGTSAANLMQLVYTLGMAEDLENWVGSPVFADYYRSHADSLWKNGCSAYWDEPTGLFAATIERDSFTVHTQCFAVLSQKCDPIRLSRIRDSLRQPPSGLVQATYYFQFYLFSAYARLGFISKILEHLPDWQQMADNGCKTTLEKPDPARSDCHAWAAHPLYHAVTTIGGIQPLGFGFKKARIAPAIHCLESADICIPHPLGKISVHWQTRHDEILLDIALPANFESQLFLNGATSRLSGGSHHFVIPADSALTDSR